MAFKIFVQAVVTDQVGNVVRDGFTVSEANHLLQIIQSSISGTAVSNFVAGGG